MAVDDSTTTTMKAWNQNMGSVSSEDAHGQSSRELVGVGVCVPGVKGLEVGRHDRWISDLRARLRARTSKLLY